MKDNAIQLDSKKELSKEAGRLGWGLILYQILLSIFVLGEFVVRGVFMMLKSKDTSSSVFDACVKQASESGWGYLLTILIGMPLLFLLFRKVSYENIWKEQQKITLHKFLVLLCIFMTSQVLFVFGGAGMEWLFNQTGHTLLGDIENASSISKTWSMFFYASVFGPISEEIIFRGFVLKTLKKYGKVFAIVTSSLLFGLYHGNFVQGVFAVLVGLVLAYVAMEYSIKWAILLHIINNGLFSDVLQFLTGKLSQDIQNYIYMGLYVGFFALGVLFLIKNAKYMKTYYSKNKTGGYCYVLRSAGIILFCIMAVVTACMGIEKL